MMANLPRHIAEREGGDGAAAAELAGRTAARSRSSTARGPGNVVLVEIAAEHVTEICTGFGEIGCRPRPWPRRAAKEMRRYLAAGVPVGLHLADQLLPVLALGGGGSFRTLSLSRHALTNADVIRQFADVTIDDDDAKTRDVVRVDVGKTVKPMKTLMKKPAVFGEHEPNTLEQLEDVASRAARAALMADGHLGYVMPIGGVAAYREQVSVVGVGFDIACGNAAIRTDLTRSSTPGLIDRLGALADEIQDVISFGIGRKNTVGRCAGRSPAVRVVGLGRAAAARARRPAQQGAQAARARSAAAITTSTCSPTRTATIWVGVHFGSRGLGHTIASGFLALSQGEKWGARVPEREVLLPLDQPMGQDYWALMTLAGEYAYAGREWVARKVVSILGGQRARARAQPSQLRLARRARRRRARRDSQGRDAGVSRPEGIRRRLDG